MDDWAEADKIAELERLRIKVKELETDNYRLRNIISRRTLSYEDRDHIIIKIIELVDQKILEEFAVRQEAIDRLIWTDELLSKVEDLFEPYSDGWRNYN
jgi:F0F1-type ATP synthase delta subunit